MSAPVAPCAPAAPLYRQRGLTLTDVAATDHEKLSVPMLSWPADVGLTVMPSPVDGENLGG